jgi:hypothetical protein
MLFNHQPCSNTYFWVRNVHYPPLQYTKFSIILRIDTAAHSHVEHNANLTNHFRHTYLTVERESHIYSLKISHKPRVDHANLILITS